MKDIFADQIKVTAKQFPDKSIIFETGRPANHILYLEKGLVKLERITQEGKEVITSLVKEGEYVAVAALFSDVYKCTAKALSDVTLRVYLKRAVLAGIEKNSKILLELVWLLSGQVHELREQVEILSIQSAEERILTFLKARSDGGLFRLPKDVKNLAAQLGLTQETLYRKLKQLEERNLIKREEHGISFI